MSNLIRNSRIRAWFFPGRTAPNKSPDYKGRYAIGDISQALGDVTIVEEPSPDYNDSFETIAVIRGASAMTNVELTGRLRMDDEYMKELGTCSLDFQAHVGECTNPQDYSNAWKKAWIFEDAYLTSYNIGGFSAMQSSERGILNETMQFAVRNIYSVSRLKFKTIGGGLLSLGNVAVYSSKHCIDCERSTRLANCEVVVALSDSTGAVHWTTNGWTTNTVTGITGAVGIGTAIAISGKTLYVGTSDNRISIIDLTKLVSGSTVWTNITTASIPRVMKADRQGNVWVGLSSGQVLRVVGNRIENTYATLGVNDVRDIAVSPNVSGIDTVLVTGDNNNIWFTQNDGNNWVQVTAPVAGSYRAAHVFDDQRWYVGTLAGQLYYTENRGANWTLMPIATSVIEIRKIVFATPSVGYILARNNLNENAIYRTLCSGGVWHLMPEDGTTSPTTTAYKGFAVCHNNPNLFYACGTMTAGSGGVLLKASI